MARIVISLSGEGRGHAARTLTLLEMLAGQHTCLVLAPASVYALMANAVQQWPSVSLQPLPSLSFQYRASGQLSYWRSALAAAPFILRREQLIQSVVASVDPFASDLAITDFEPLLPRVARRLRIPTLSLDHQHFLYAMDMSILPPALRRRAQFLRPSVKLFCPAADRHLVSSFYRYPQRRGTESCQQIGVLLRQNLLREVPREGEHLLVYLRRQGSADWLEPLQRSGCPVWVYGTEFSGRRGNLLFKPISNTAFIKDLASCRALVTTAGNQLVGEALSLRKPVLAIPERGNFEQALNGFFLNRSGVGLSVDQAGFNGALLQSFLERQPAFVDALAHPAESGNAAVLRVVEQLLPGRCDRPAAPAPSLARSFA